MSAGWRCSILWMVWLFLLLVLDVTAKVRSIAIGSRMIQTCLWSFDQNLAVLALWVMEGWTNAWKFAGWEFGSALDVCCPRWVYHITTPFIWSNLCWKQLGSSLWGNLNCQSVFEMSLSIVFIAGIWIRQRFTLQHLVNGVVVCFACPWCSCKGSIGCDWIWH